MRRTGPPDRARPWQTRRQRFGSSADSLGPSAPRPNKRWRRSTSPAGGPSFGRIRATGVSAPSGARHTRRTTCTSRTSVLMQQLWWPKWRPNGTRLTRTDFGANPPHTPWRVARSPRLPESKIPGNTGWPTSGPAPWAIPRIRVPPTWATTPQRDHPIGASRNILHRREIER